MKNSKKEIHMNGKLLRPLSIGKGALFHSGGQIYHTSLVIAVHEQSESMIRFETKNSNYFLSLNPFLCAAIKPLPVSLAACA